MAVTDASADYIVVGGGTAGCVLAARLSEDPAARVLLLEAGGAERTPAMSVPADWPQNLGSAADWADVTTAQADAGPGLMPRGKTLGGSSAVNALAHVRGHRGVFLTDARDTARLAAGLELVREAGASAAFGTIGAAEVWPGPETATDGGLRGYIRRGVGSYYHPAGTCAIGPVVDAGLRAHGIAGLRIADASVIPLIPNAHPNATVLAIAEKAAELISGAGHRGL